MVLSVESNEGQVRIGVNILSEFIAQEAIKVPGVVDTFENILPTIKITENGQVFQANDKVDVKHRSLEVSLVISLDPKCIYWKVASEVQKNIFSMIEKQFGFALKKVNIEVGRVEWSSTSFEAEV